MDSMGPTGYLPSIMHRPEEEIPLDTMEDAFYRPAAGLVRGGVDGLVIETSVGIVELKAAIRAARRAGGGIPVMANMTLAQAGRMLLGTPVEAAYNAVCGMGIDVFSINCSTGPLEMKDCIRWLDDPENADHHYWWCRTSAYQTWEKIMASIRCRPARCPRYSRTCS